MSVFLLCFFVGHSTYRAVVVFCMLDVGGSGALTRKAFEDALDRVSEQALPVLLSRFFDEHETMSFQQFDAWCSEHTHDLILTEWIYAPPMCTRTEGIPTLHEIMSELTKCLPFPVLCIIESICFQSLFSKSSNLSVDITK